MPRTTLDIDTQILDEVKRVQSREKGSLGKVVSRLLSEALSRQPRTSEADRLDWISKPMGARVDLTDKDALYRELEDAGST